MNISLVLAFICMIFFQNLHVYEEIACGALRAPFAVKKHLTQARYLRACSVLSLLTLGTLTMLIFNLRFGIYLALFLAVFIGLGNAIVHLVGLVATKSYRNSLGAGAFSGIPLGIAAVVVLWFGVPLLF